jgi:hypothetical protein
MSDNYFSFRGQDYEYFDHPHNNTRINERTVEIPISFNFLDKIKDNLVEVGCVTPYYRECSHEVIDLTDDHPKSKKVDAVQYNFDDKNVLSISTVEHVGLSDYGIQAKEDNAAIQLCEKIINTSLKYFITWPLGYNKILDSWAFNLKNSLFISRRDDNKYLWKQKEVTELTEDNKVYGSFHCANSIIILTNFQ